MNEYKHPQKLRSKILNYFCAILIGTILILDTFFIYIMSITIQKDTHIYAYEIVKQLGRNIQTYTNHMEEIAWMIINQDINIMYQLKKPLEEPKVEKSYSIEQFRIKGNTTNDIASIFIFGENGLTLVDHEKYIIKDYVNIKEMDWYKQAVAAKGKPVISSSHMQNYIETDGKWVFSVSCAIIDPETQALLGVILIDMSYKDLADMCNNISLGKNGYVYVVNQQQQIIYHPKQQLIYSDILQEDLGRIMKQQEGSFIEEKGEQRLITVHGIEGTDWSVVGVSYIGDLLISQNQIFMALLIITFICIVLSFIVSRRVAEDISSPISKLEKIMSQVENGNLDTDMVIHANTEEIQKLAHSFQTMLIQIKILIAKVEQNQKKLRKTELKVLQAQINPHFLYNTLDTIIWLGEKEEHEKVVNVTIALARYFRLSLNKGREIITIFSEIEHVKNYLLIQKMRYNKKLTYTITVNPEVYDYMIVKIILQPLVENAIYHGIKDSKEGGHIHIKGHKEGKNILLIVEDNGKGMTAEECAEILVKPISKSITSGGVAIKNVHERLQIYFGEQYGLYYESTLGKGTKVQIKIPLLEEGEDEG